MKKRRILLISLFVLLGMVIFNFWINSAYYAVHSKYTSQDEVPGVIIDHLDDIMIGVRNERFGDYFLQVDGSSSIDYKFSEEGEKSLDNIGGYKGSYFYTKSKNGVTYIYNLDKKMKILSISTMDNEIHKVTPKDQDEVKKDLYELVKPLLKRVTKPFINLQWLYDFIFRKY
ncbi:hypothetical protein [Streptococcus pluranimalium]|uniref:Uncharacterized protein n=1 Tax=Streptococcus pluranimalium TaxID=82348 RepID=A0A345VN08_9STRE|nr:hypothetical protein [Streptococcus pluranimalium]AXJ14110.1 hypothetical protein Sp14A_22280 [Streptococcus pluranimalium]